MLSVHSGLATGIASFYFAKGIIRNSLRRWIAQLLLATSGAGLLLAADNQSPPQSALAPAGGTNLSGAAPIKRARWREHLTLGPGDVLNLSLLDMPETARTEVPVGPDGRITFLQARDIMAAGLTIDELRAKMDEALKKFHQNPHTVIAPVAIRTRNILCVV
jgi:protein involved in polysaccharide export with SLBB domain